MIIPSVDHNFQPLAADPVRRLWDRVTFAAQGRPVSTLALETLAPWAARVLAAVMPPAPRGGMMTGGVIRQVPHGGSV